VPAQDSEITGFAKVLYNKFYVDEIYTAIIVQPIYAIGSFFKNVVETAISGFIFGLGKAVNALGTEGKVLQNGSVGFYLFAFVLGFCSIIVYIFLAK
jgi:NADH-quinone oxidoreductase subunit L